MDTLRLERNTHELRPRVRRHLDAARADLEELRQLQHDYYNGTTDQVDHGSFNRVQPQERRYLKTYTLDALDAAFDQLENGLRAHYQHEDQALYPAIRQFLRTGQADLKALVEAQQREHVELLRQGAAVQREVMFVPPLKGPMSALLQHLEKQVRYEETRIFPELLGAEVEEETPIPQRYRTSDDLARSLRVARPEPQPEPEPEPGLLTGLFNRWLKNR